MLYRCPCFPLSIEHSLYRLYAVVKLKKAILHYFEHEKINTILIITLYSPGGLLDEYAGLYETIKTNYTRISEIILLFVCDEKKLTESEMLAHKDFFTLFATILSKISVFYMVPKNYVYLLQGKFDLIMHESVMSHEVFNGLKNSQKSAYKNDRKEQILWIQINWDPHEHTGIYLEENDRDALCYYHFSAVSLFHYISHLYYTQEGKVFLQEFSGYKETLFFQLFYFQSPEYGEIVEQKIFALPQYYYDFIYK